eukprot:7048568-Prymnesium_polylepis.2
MAIRILHQRCRGPRRAPVARTAAQYFSIQSRSRAHQRYSQTSHTTSQTQSCALACRCRAGDLRAEFAGTQRLLQPISPRAIRTHTTIHVSQAHSFLRDLWAATEPRPSHHAVSDKSLVAVARFTAVLTVSWWRRPGSRVRPGLACSMLMSSIATSDRNASSYALT